MQWLDRLVERVVSAHPSGEILIESGSSPSGVYHLGHIRELVICDGLLLELKKRGRQARHISYIDDLDALRKIPVNVPDEYEKYLGVSLCDIPAPDGNHGSYADYFLKDLIDVSSALGMEVEFVRTHQKYRSGFFTPAIERSLQHADRIKPVLEQVSGHKLDDTWSPIQINEDGYLKKRRFISIDTDSKALNYEDVNGQQKTTGYGKGEVKLDWRVDWPARWWLLGVSVEPFGRDHASAGGSYDTGAALTKEVFDGEPPFPVPYDFVNLAGDTKKMSASKGTGLDAAGVVKILPPEAVRFFFLRYPPSKRLYFDPVGGVSQLIDELAELLEKEPDSQLAKLSRGSVKSVVSRIPFSHLVASYQAGRHDSQKTLEIVSRTEHKEAVENQKDTIVEELTFIQNWLDNWAPKELKFNIEEELDGVLRSYQFNEPQKKFLRDFGEKIEQENPEEGDGEWFHKAIYELRDSNSLDPKLAFEAIYHATIGKPYGPRAGWFLSILPREWLINRLKLED